MFIYYSVITVITISVLLIGLIGAMSVKIDVGKQYSYIFISIMVTAFCEWAGVALDGKPLWNDIHLFVKFVEFSVAPLIPLLMAEVMVKKTWFKVYLPFLSFNALLELFSCYFGFIFYVDSEGYYHHNSFYFIYILSYVVAFAYMCWIIAAYCRHNKYRNNTYLTLVIGFLFSGIIVQSLFSSIKVDWLCAALAALLMYIHYCTQEQRKTLDKQQIVVEEAIRANAAKTSFLNRMSHDLRTPINGIAGMLHIAQNNIDNREIVENCLSKIDQASSHLLSLINDVLDVSKLDGNMVELKHDPFNLAETFDQCVTIMGEYAAERSVTLHWSEALSKITAPHVYGSPLHVRQIFLNLLSNSIKYNRVGGKVDFQCVVMNETEDTITYRFHIVDNGIGMSEEFQKKIFEPFSRESDVVQANYQGSGLGMSIVKELVDLMKGSIHVMSQKNVGTTFVVDLPFDKDKNPAPEEKVETVSTNLKGKRLLVVEDNSLNMEIVCYMLSEDGIVFDTAENGKEAIYRFQNSPEGYYDGILMDVMMPIMNGIEATKYIRSLPRKDASRIPILAMTANAFEEDKQETRAAGMNAHLSKPLDALGLHQALSRYIV